MSYGMDYQGGGGGMGGGSSSYGGGGYNDGGSGGGGFQSGGGSQETTPARARKSYDEQTLIPVTVRMILSSTANDNSNLMLTDGRELHHVKVVGAVRSYDEQSTHVQFSVEDGTGLLDVKQWLDANDCAAVVELRQSCLQDNTYLKIMGQVKDYDGKKTLVAHSIRPLQTSNELSHHMLDVVYSAQVFERKDAIVGSGSGVGMGGGAGVGFGGGGAPVVAQSTAGGASVGGQDDVRNQVMNFIRAEGRDSIGVNISRCFQLFNGRFTESEIRAAVESLSSEGHIYSTIDEQHYSFAM